VPGSVAAHHKEEIRVLTPEEAKMLLRAARGRGSRPSRSWPSPPGCVMGELLGLQWLDVDLKEAIATRAPAFLLALIHRGTYGKN